MANYFISKTKLNFMKSLILDLDIFNGKTVIRQNFDMGIFLILTNKIYINHFPSWRIQEYIYKEIFLKRKRIKMKKGERMTAFITTKKHKLLHQTHKES